MSFTLLKSKNALASMAGAFFVVSINAFAQAPVVSRNAVPEPVPSNSSIQAIVELQALREEVSSLRGVIESLEYKLNKLERQQDANYQDLDGRVSSLYQNDGSYQNSVPNSGTPVSSSSSNVINVNSGVVSDIASPSDYSMPSANAATAESKAIYERGFEALRKGERDNALLAFQSVLDYYPASAEMADSLYWLGQTYWLANKREESRESFVRLLDNFPEYRKKGDAMYRLGIIYDQLGDNEKAYDYMSQVLLSGSGQVAAAQLWISENISN